MSGLAGILALQADPVAVAIAGVPFRTEFRRHHRHAARGADGRALIIETGRSHR
jgi:hypothetical protein